MNSFQGKIVKIETSGSLSLVEIIVSGFFLKTILVETPETVSFLKENKVINIFLKETEVIIGKGISHSISIQNKIPGIILEIEKDRLLSKILIDTNIGGINAIIETNAIDELQFEVGEKVMAMIKFNEIMISE